MECEIMVMGELAVETKTNILPIKGNQSTSINSNGLVEVRLIR